MKKTGLYLAIAALLVNMPRFVLLFLQVDQLRLPMWLEGGMLALTGIATGLVLTGGGAYIAHTLAQPTRGGIARVMLGACWVLLLIFSVILLAPALVAAIRISEMRTVLDDSTWQWTWAIVAILAVEVLAGGAMVAHALSDSEPASRPQGQGAMNLIAGALAQRIASTVQGDAPQLAPQPKSAPMPVASNAKIEQSQEPDGISEADKRKARRDSVMLWIRDGMQGAQADLADKWNVDPSTINRDIKWLENNGSVYLNGDGRYHPSVGA